MGALLFGAYALLTRGRAQPEAASPVVIGAGEVRWLTETWARQWRREPTPEELRGLVTDLVREELLARAARDMRLDQEDVIVRRRLAQKLEFVLRDGAENEDPPESELQRLYTEHPERFREEARRSLTQIVFSSSRPDARRDATHALRQLLEGADPSAIRGDRSSSPTSCRMRTSEPWRPASEPSSPARSSSSRSARGVAPSPAPTASIWCAWSRPPGPGSAHSSRPAASSSRSGEPSEGVSARHVTLAELGEKYGVVLDDTVRRLVGPVRVAPSTRTGAP